jgi:hypothetical protein
MLFFKNENEINNLDENTLKIDILHLALPVTHIKASDMVQSWVFYVKFLEKCVYDICVNTFEEVRSE